MSTLKNTTINATGYVKLPSGTTAQRPASPTAGMLRYNSTTGMPEWYSGSAWVSSPAPSSAPAQLLGVTYTVSGTYSSNSPPTYQYMNDNNANGLSNGNQWGSNNGATEYITADIGSVKTITKIVLGYDYLTNLPGGWGVTYTQGKSIDTSSDGSTWTTQTTTPTYSLTGSTNGLVSIIIPNVSARYVRMSSVGWVCTLEFQVWGY